MDIGHDDEGAPILRWTDNHCHLPADPAQQDEQVADAAAAGVDRLITVGCDLPSSQTCTAAAQRHGSVWATAGVHPHEARHGLDGLEALLGLPGVVAVGECGLDFHYDHAPREVQGRAMRAQWRLAIELGLPVVVHNRESNEAMLAAVAEPEFAALEADFHSFAGGLAMAEALIERGFYLGFTGMITFRAADNVREVIPRLPPDRELVETDTPYLAPVPYRGKPNRPAYVVEVARRLAEERGESYEATCRRTGENFRRLFPRAA